MKQLLEKVTKLIDLKSLITLSLTIALIYGFVVGKVETKDFLVYVTMVFTFYFAKKDKAEEERLLTKTEEMEESKGSDKNE